MRMTITEISGTAEELAAFDRERHNADTSERVQAQAYSVPEDIRRFVADRAPHERRAAIGLDYLGRLAELGYTFALGRSAKKRDGLQPYAMVRHPDARGRGALAYFRPISGGLALRLPERESEGIAYAEPRRRADAYQVWMPMTSEEGVDAAIALTERARAMVGEWAG
jgi:hypothetical protein